MGYEDVPSIPMGFRFRPTHQELLHYLKDKLSGKPHGDHPIADVDLYDFGPWDLPSKSKLKDEFSEWCFYSRLRKKYGKKSSKINRETNNGLWKITAPDVKVRHNSRTSGFSGTRKNLTFYSRQGGRLVRTNWGMHEYSLGDKESYGNSYVVCKIFRKPHDEAVGGEAPSGEASREHDDVAVVAPGETAATGVVADDGGYVEAADLSQDVNHSGVFIEDYQLPVGGTSKTSELYRDPKFAHFPEQHGMDAEPWTDGFTEAHDAVTPMEVDSACLGPADNPDLYFDLSELLVLEDSGPHDSQKDVDSWVFVEDYQQPVVGTSQAPELHPDQKNVHNLEQYVMVAEPLKGTENTRSSLALKNEIVGADQVLDENLSASFDTNEFLNLDGYPEMGLFLSEILGTENTRPPVPRQNEIAGANQVSEAKMDESGGDGHKHA